MTRAFVLDTYAVLALIGRESGGEEVALLLRQAQSGTASVAMTWVNVGEVAYIVERRWGQDKVQHALALLEAAALEIIPVGQELALWAAHIKASHALSYADAYAAALASARSATLVTGDPEFRTLEGSISVRWLPREN